MEIIESSVIGKQSDDSCEDGLVVTDSYIAVIDGSTSKTPFRISEDMKNGRYSMLLIADYIRHMRDDLTCDEFCDGITANISSLYNDTTPLPENRLTASAIIYSERRKEIWIVGDCQCCVDGKIYDNNKPYEEEVAEKRVSLIKQGMSPKDARSMITPLLIAKMQEGQNKQYAVIDGTPIYKDGIKKVDVSESHEIIFASDGYPFLKQTLKESEDSLAEQLHSDPQNISTFIATKGIVGNNKSFDDRTYIRFII